MVAVLGCRLLVSCVHSCDRRSIRAGASIHAEYVNRFLLRKYHKQKTIGAAVARAEKQFADGLIERCALGGQRTPLGVACESLCSLACAPDPVARRAGCLAADIAVG